MPDELLKEAIRKPTDERLWAIAEGLRRGYSIEEVNRLSRVDPWFLRKIQGLLIIEQRLLKAKESKGTSENLATLVADAFLIGFPSPAIRSLLLDGSEDLAYNQQASEEIERQKVMPVFKMVDTCAGEFESQTPYYYGTFEQEDDQIANVH